VSKTAATAHPRSIEVVGHRVDVVRHHHGPVRVRRPTHECAAVLVRHETTAPISPADSNGCACAADGRNQNLLNACLTIDLAIWLACDTINMSSVLYNCIAKDREVSGLSRLRLDQPTRRRLLGSMVSGLYATAHQGRNFDGSIVRSIAGV
jgi:hypothetical protein